MRRASTTLTVIAIAVAVCWSAQAGELDPPGPPAPTMVTLQYDAALLFSADGDYADVIDEVRAAGKKVYVAFFKDSKSHHLEQAANGFLDITNFDFNNLRFYRKRG